MNQPTSLTGSYTFCWYKDCTLAEVIISINVYKHIRTINAFTFSRGSKDIWIKFKAFPGLEVAWNPHDDNADDDSTVYYITVYAFMNYSIWTTV